jgi:hypothetical protein
MFRRYNQRDNVRTSSNSTVKKGPIFSATIDKSTYEKEELLSL